MGSLLSVNKISMVQTGEKIKQNGISLLPLLKYNAETFLSGFQGYLEIGGYQGYHNLSDIKQCCCWSLAPWSNEVIDNCANVK